MLNLLSLLQGLECSVKERPTKNEKVRFRGGPIGLEHKKYYVESRFSSFQQNRVLIRFGINSGSFRSSLFWISGRKLRLAARLRPGAADRLPPLTLTSWIRVFEQSKLDARRSAGRHMWQHGCMEANRSGWLAAGWWLDAGLLPGQGPAEGGDLL